MSSAQIVRKSLRVRDPSSRPLDQRLALRFPRLADAFARLIIGRLPPTSRVRQAAVWRGSQLGMEAFNRRDVDAAVSYGHADFEFEPPREFVEVGFEQIAACVDRLERAVSIARWSESPDTRRWRVGLRLIPTGTRHGGTPVGQVLELLSSLPGVLAEVQTPDEEQEQPRVYFGWSGLGKKTRPPGSVRSS